MTVLANICTPFHETSDVTFRATDAVTGKRFLKISGNRTGGPALSTDLENVYQAAHCGAGEKAVGVSKYDVADGELGGLIGTPGRIVPVACGADLTAGQEVQSDANGMAIPLAAGKALGIAMDACDITVAGDKDAVIKLY